MNVRNYFVNYNTFNQKVVYDFKLGDGGIGDCIKFFMYALHLCAERNYKLFYLKNNIQLEKYLKIRYEQMYVDRHLLECNTHNVDSVQTMKAIDNSCYNIITPYIFYSSFNFDKIDVNIQDVFYFSNEVIENSFKLLPCNVDNYISLHLRMGDKYLETDKNFVLCKEDSRGFDESKVFNFIEANYDKNIIFFCDNKNYKLMLKEKYNNIIILDSNIGHTSLSNTTEKQVLDTVTEFFILSNSQRIYSASYSGFSIIASKFKNIPLINI